MAFEGDLSHLALGDVLQTLAMTRQTGTFVVRNPSEERRLTFGPRGCGLLSVRQAMRDRVCDWLVGKGKADAEALQNAAKLARRKKDVPVEEVLQEKGLVTGEDVLEARRYVAAEEIYDLFLWTQGNFEFLTADGEPAAPYGGAWFDIVSIAMEAARRMDEVGRLKESLPPNEVLRRADEAGDPDPKKVGNDAVMALALVDGTLTVEGLLQATHLGRFDMWKALDALREGGFVKSATPDQMAGTAEELLRLKEHGKAGAILRRILELNPEDDAARRNLIQALTAAGDKRGAGSQWMEFARRADAVGDVAASIESFRQAVRLDKDNSEAQDGLARVLLASGELEQGVEAARAAASLHVDAHAFDAAISIADLAVRASPEDPGVRIALANAYIAGGDPANGLLLLDDAASLLETCGDERRLLDVYRRIVQLDPARKDCVRRIDEIVSRERYRRRRLAQRVAIGAGVVLLALASVPMLRGPSLLSRIGKAQLALDAGEADKAQAILAEIGLPDDLSDEEMTALNKVRDDLAKSGPRKLAAEAAKRIDAVLTGLGTQAADAMNRDAWAECLSLHGKALDALDGADATLLGGVDLPALTRFRKDVSDDVLAALQQLSGYAAAKMTVVVTAREKFVPEVFKKEDTEVLEDLVQRTDAVAEIRAAQDWPEIARLVAATRKRVPPSKDNWEQRILEAIAAMTEAAPDTPSAFDDVETQGARARAALTKKRFFEKHRATRRETRDLLAAGKVEDGRDRCREFQKFCDDIRLAEPRALYEPIVKDWVERYEPEVRLTLLDIETVLAAEQRALDALDAGDTDAAFRIRTELVRRHRGVDFQNRFRLPLRIESRPAGATVVRVDADGKEEVVGRTTIARFDYPVETGCKLVLRLDGYEDVAVERGGALYDESGLLVVELPKKADFTTLLPRAQYTHAVETGDTFVLGGRDGVVRHLSARDGSEAAPAFASGSLGGFEAAPALHGDRLFAVTKEGEGFVLDARTNQRLHGFRAGGAVSADLLETPRGVVCVTESGTATLLGPDGAPVWTADVGRVYGDPVLAGDRVVFTVRDALLAKDLATGRGDVRVPLPPAAAWSGPVAVGDRVWLTGDTDQGCAACVDLRERKVVWTVPLLGEQPRRPTVADGRVLVATAKGSLLQLDLRTGHVLARDALGGPVRHPAVALGTGWAVVTERGTIHRFDATGQPVWRYDARDDAPSPASFAGGRIVVVTKSGQLVSLRP